MENPSTGASDLLCVRMRKRDFSRMTAFWNGGSLPPSHVVGEKLIAKEMRADGVLPKSGRRCAPLHKACPSIFLCPKSLPVHKNVAISTNIHAMLVPLTLHLLPVYSSRFISITSQLRSYEFINFQPGRWSFYIHLGQQVHLCHP